MVATQYIMVYNNGNFDSFAIIKIVHNKHHKNINIFCLFDNLQFIDLFKI